MENFAQIILFIFEKLDFFITITYCLSRQNELALNFCEPNHNQFDPETIFQLTSEGGWYKNLDQIPNLDKFLPNFETQTLFLIISSLKGI